MEDKLAGKELLASIRTANRLAYEYQKRILEFMSYFKMKFRLEDNQIAAIKRDSNAFYKTKAYSDDYSDANLKVWTNGHGILSIQISWNTTLDGLKGIKCLFVCHLFK